MIQKRKDRSIAFVSPFGLPVLLDPPESGAGGAERQFFLFGKGLVKEGWSVCYITDAVAKYKSRNTVMPVKTASFSFMGGSKRRILLDGISLLYAMWRANSSYYVVKTPAYLLIPMCIFTKMFGRKLVFWAQMEFDAYPELRPFTRTVSRLMSIGVSCADIIIAQNRSQVEGFKKNFGKEARQIQSIAGVFCEENGESNNNKESIDVLWVGNSMTKKRYEIVVALARMLPEYSFAVAMNKTDPARYSEAEARCRAESNIKFLGEVNPLDMESWYGRARLLINTSTQEGFPNTYLQAWEHGIPVVSLCVDPDDVITEHSLGVVIDKGLTEILEGDGKKYAGIMMPHIKRILTDRELYKALSVNAKGYVARYHSESVVVERLEAILLDGRECICSGRSREDSIGSDP